jgi:hypothetical protein
LIVPTANELETGPTQNDTQYGERGRNYQKRGATRGIACQHYEESTAAKTHEQPEESCQEGPDNGYFRIMN